MSDYPYSSPSTHNIGWYLLQHFDTPWLSAFGWLLLGMLLDQVLVRTSQTYW
jgi:hypothetical protein